MDHLLRQFVSFVGGIVLIPSFLTTSVPTPTVMPSPTITPSPFPTATAAPTSTPIPTPTKTPKPTPIAATAEQLDGWFTQYSKEYSVDRQRLWNIAVCESTLKTNAVNGDYAGLYQFSTGTWKSTRKRMNLPSDPLLRFHPEESIRTAAFLLSTRGHSPWPNCSE